MTHIVLKYALSAVLIVAVSEIAKRSSLLGGLIASLPLVSVMGMIWLYQETRDTAKVAALSTSIFWLVLPSLIFFVVLPALVKRHVSFYPALGLSILAMLLSYGAMVFALSKFGIKL
jgi:F0F1-type ATP synthase assembly protein I